MSEEGRELDIQGEKPDRYRVVGDVPDPNLSGLWVSVAGRYRAGSEYTLGPRTLARDYILIYTEAGEGEIRAGTERATASIGDLFLLVPGVEHEYRTRGATWQLTWLHMRADGMPQLAPAPGWRSEWVPPTPCRPDAQVPALFASILYELEQKRPYFAHAAGASAQLILVELLRSCRTRWGPRLTTGETPFGAVNAYILARLDRPVTAAELARLLHVSPRHLGRLFNRYFGQSPKRYVLRLKIAEAKRLLLSTDLPVAEIADRLGFIDHKYFARLFRRWTSQLPADFRDEHRPID